METCSTAPSAGGAAPVSASAGLFEAVLNVSLAAIQLWRPLFGSGGAVVDFAPDCLNPAGQRMLALPERPGGSLLVHFPGPQGAGIFAFCQRVFATGEAGRHEANCPRDGSDSCCHLAAQRHEDRLVVSFTAATFDASDRAGHRDPVYRNVAHLPLRSTTDGPVTGVAAVATDVTEQGLARQQPVGTNHKLAALNDKLYAANAALAGANEDLNVVNGRLTRANADLDTFAHTASHNLRTPIANPEGLLRALVEQLPPAVRHDAEVRPLLGLMQGAVARFQLTLPQLTDPIREANAPAQPAEPVALVTLVEGVRLDPNGLVASTQPRLLVNVAGCSRLTFAPRNLRSIVYNLLSNALKYRRPARTPVVHLRCRSTARAAVLEVEDNGHDRDESQQARLFGLFECLHPHVEGSGVGLYTVRKIVENAGGTSAVRSQPGVGTAFTVTLPVPA